jgi:hypothetical protein
MRRLTLVLLIFTLVPASAAGADWRWAPPKAEKRTVTTKCNTLKCLDTRFAKERKRLAHKIKVHDQRRLREWKRWTSLPIANCTWYGESGTGPEFAPYRYTTPNSTGSGAYGKYQFMPGTYSSNAKYHDWSALDQEIAGHREYQKHGVGPWSNCTK